MKGEAATCHAGSKRQGLEDTGGGLGRAAQQIKPLCATHTHLTLSHPPLPSAHTLTPPNRQPTLVSDPHGEQLSQHIRDDMIGGSAGIAAQQITANSTIGQDTDEEQEEWLVKGLTNQQKGQLCSQ